MWALSLSGLLNSLVQPTWVLVRKQKNKHKLSKTITDKKKKGNRRTDFSMSGTSPEGTFVFFERFVNEHVSLHFVLPVERRLAEGAFVRLFT